MRGLFVLFCLFSFTTGAALAQTKDAVEDSSYSFTTDSLPIQIHLSPQTTAFSVQPDRRFDFKIAGAVWCYVLLKVQSGTKQSRVLYISNTSLDSVFIYAVQPDGAKRIVYSGGNEVAYDRQKTCVWHKVALEASTTPLYYLLAMKAAAQNVNVDYAIVRPDAFFRLYRSLDRLVFFYGSFVLFISFITLIGGLIFKRTAFFIYTGYVLSLAGWILAHYGFLFSELYPSFPRLNGIIKQLTTLTAMLCLLSLVAVSFGKELNKRWQRIFLSLKGFAALLCFFYLVHLTGIFGDNVLMAVNVLWNVSLLVSVCFILTALATLVRTNRSARLFTLAISLVSVMAIYQSLSNMNWGYNYFLNEHGMTAASMLEVLLLTFGIFYNQWKEKRDKENALQVAEGERTRVLQMLVGVQEDERKRIAGDLHDSIGPMLAAIKINFMRLAKAKTENRSAEELAVKTENIIDESITEIRDISHRLMPKNLSSKGLIKLLSEYFSGLEATHSIRINFSHNINVSLDKEVQLNLYRMISELALNAAKHSGAEWLSVSIKTAPDETAVEIKDDGVGFTRGGKEGTTLGIKNVQSRVEYLGGKMQLVSAPDKGTTIEIIIPHNSDSEFHQP